LRQIRHVALDMDGTIYCGDRLFASTRPFLALLRQLGIGHTFLTNNSSKSTHDYVKHLRNLGVRASTGQIYTSTQATIAYLREAMPAARRLFVLGTASLQKELTREGFSLAADRPSDPPDAVVVGFDTGLAFSRLCRAAHWIAQGKPFIATHPDRVCPTNLPTVLVDCGSICAALEKATGRKPDAVPGKPDARMLRGILQRHSLTPAQLAMVGDRLYTDMAMARRAGVLGVLVLTGETKATEKIRRSDAPKLIVRDLRVLGERLREAHESARC
jgi:HAD superfamily hydrolase (TIGR01450 family)